MLVVSHHSAVAAPSTSLTQSFLSLLLLSSVEGLGLGRRHRLQRDHVPPRAPLLPAREEQAGRGLVAGLLRVELLPAGAPPAGPGPLRLGAALLGLHTLPVLLARPVLLRVAQQDRPHGQPLWGVALPSYGGPDLVLLLVQRGGRENEVPDPALPRLHPG